MAHLIVDNWQLEYGNHELNNTGVYKTQAELAFGVAGQHGLRRSSREALSRGWFSFIGTYERGGDRRSKLDWAHCIYLYMLVKIFPDDFIHEYNNRLILLDTGLVVSDATISRTLFFSEADKEDEGCYCRREVQPSEYAALRRLYRMDGKFDCR